MEGIIAGDDDNLTDFSGTQFENDLNLAQIAIQDELADLASDKVLPYEQSSAYITLVNGTRAYSLASDFIRFTDEEPFLLRVDAATSTGTSQGYRLWSWHGGEENLRRAYMDYRSTTSSPGWFYPTGGTSHQIGIFPVPDSNAAGDIYRYYYDKSITVSVTTDTIPLITAEAANAFCEAAGLRFRYLRMPPQERQVLFPGGLNTNPQIQQARSRLIEFVRIERPTEKYGRKYC